MKSPGHSQGFSKGSQNLAAIQQKFEAKVHSIFVRTPLQHDYSHYTVKN